MADDYRDRETLRKLYEDEHLTVRQVAGRLYCSESAVIRWMKLHEIPRRHRGFGSGRKAKRFIRVGHESLTIKQIAQRAGVCESTVRNRLAKEAGPEELLRGPGKKGRKKGWSPLHC